jgi:hypothetical protein
VRSDKSAKLVTLPSRLWRATLLCVEYYWDMCVPHGMIIVSRTQTHPICNNNAMSDETCHRNASCYLAFCVPAQYLPTGTPKTHVKARIRVQPSLALVLKAAADALPANELLKQPGSPAPHSRRFHGRNGGWFVLWMFLFN